MDNITHTLLGVALAEVALPHDTTKTTTRLFVAAGAIAANAPDIDLLYVGLTPFPLGYLLHHRGHTHTVIGAIAQVVVIAVVCQLALRLLEGPGKWRARLWGLIAAALGSHVALDACNTYGVHPFHPFDPRWYFGDTLFIFEPWIWLVLCLTVGLSVQSRAIRAIVIAPMAVLLTALTVVSVLSVGTYAALMVSGLAGAWATRSWTRRTRAAGGVAALVVFVAAMSGVSARARAETRELMAADAAKAVTNGVTNAAANAATSSAAPASATAAKARGEIVDIVLTPDPAMPVCWTVIAIERHREAGTFVTRRGTLSLWPAWRSPEGCASYRLTGFKAARRIGDGRLVWSEEIVQPLATLRDLAARDCWVAAWLQFGRVPVLRGDRLFDLRFEGPRNFSSMTLRQPAAALDAPPAATTVTPCPAHLTRWAMPRADLLQDPPLSSWQAAEKTQPAAGRE